MYAKLCKRLSKEAPNQEPESSTNSTFLCLLLNVCRDKFVHRATHKEKNLYDPPSPPITTEEEEKKHVVKRKMLGNVKFIGELCKLDMLSDGILHRCIQTLLEKDSRPSTSIQDQCEDIECLSQLIRTCGKNLDTEQGKMLMDQYFLKMLRRSENSKYPPRIRFMLRDVIEMRKNDWTPRKVASTEGPMPIHQLTTDDDLNITPNYNNRGRNMRNGERDANDWMNRLPSNMQYPYDMYSSPIMSGGGNISSPYTGSPNNYNNRDNRSDNNGGGGGNNGGGGGNYRHNNQRNNQIHNFSNRYNKHNNQNNYNNSSSHNNSYNSNNILNNKELAPRFKRGLITPNQDPVENLQMRPAANSLLFKANMNIKTTLPLSQPKANNGNSLNSSYNHHVDNSLQQNIIKIPSPAPVNNINKEQILIKQASLEKPKQNKKDKGPNKEEYMKKITIFINENLLNLSDEKNLDDLIQSFLELKVPDKFLKDSIVLILNDVLEKSDPIHDRTIEFLIQLKKEQKLQNNSIIESFKTVVNGMQEKEVTIPRITTIIATLLSRAVTGKLCTLADVSSYTENGQHYPLFLLVLQQLYKQMGKEELIEIFNESKIKLMYSLPESDRTKDRMAEILEDRNLSFLYPLLKVQGELWKQIQVDSNPQVFYKWIKDNVDANCLIDPGFITAMMTVLLKYITQETTLAEGIDATKNPDKILIEKEKSLLEKYCPVLNAFLNGHSDLQLVAVYALQVYCFSVEFPKGMLLRWFTALYELNVIEEDSFIRWKEDITEVYPGKGKALFQVNTWLTWLQEAESEDEEDEE